MDYRWKSLMTLILLSLSSSWAHANPEGGKVTAGSATIENAGKKLDVHQHTNKAVIDWRKFDIKIDEHTQFHQPSNAATALNRVNTPDPSKIMGKLSANGNVILINPNGIFFGKGSKVDVNSIIASSADIKNQDFMSKDKMHFNKPGAPNAVIFNEGHITAKEAGLVGLVAPNVLNNGIIEAKVGKVHLASGDSMMVDLHGHGLYEIKASEKITSQLISNTGVISAEGGTVLITAAAGKEIVNSLIDIKGEIHTPTLLEKGGKLIITAEGSNAVAGNKTVDKGKKQGRSTVLIENAYLSASGRNVGEKGGTIEVTADNIGVLGKSVFDVTGFSADEISTESATMRADKTVRSEAEFMAHENRAGGSVKIGGDYLGGGDTPAAQNVYIDPQSVILNDAMESGDAGRTIIWSDDTTRFYGNVFARGGAKGGNGGFLETSGKKYLDAKGRADLTANTLFRRGTYLLDPANVTVYGNVEPNFVSTDSSINLSPDLQLWFDASDTSQVQLTYSNDGLGGATAAGTIATNTITTSADISANLAVGSRIRLGAAGAVATANTMGANTYTVSAVAGTTVTTTEALSATYAGSAVRRGVVSQMGDKSTVGTNTVAQSTESRMPLWISNGKNSNGILKFDGVDDYLDGGDILDLRTNNLSIFSTFKFNALSNGIIYAKSFFSAADPRFSLLFSNGNLTSLFDIGVNSNAAIAFASTNYTTASTIIERGGDNQLFLDSDSKASTAVAADFADENGGNNFFVGVYNNSAGTAPQPGFYLDGNINEIISFKDNLSTNARNLIEQHQSAKWNIALTPPGSGATEVAKATASDGFSAFTAKYLEKLSSTADLILQATSSLTLDLKGAALTASNDRNITLQTTSGNISTASTGSIVTNRTGTGGNITINAGGVGNINIGHALTLNAQNSGTVTLTAGGGNINSNGNLTIAADTLTANDAIIGGMTWRTNSPSGTFEPGTGTLTFEQATAGNTLGIGAGGAENTIIPDATVTEIKEGFGSYIFGRFADGGNVINHTTVWEDAVTFLTNGIFTNAVATNSNDTILARAGGNVVLDNDLTTTSATASALVLSAGGNFINNAGSDALSAANSRWLVYSNEPANNTRGDLLPGASEFNKTYLANLPATIGTGNRFVYGSATQPILTYNVNAASVQFNQAFGGTTASFSSGLVTGDTISNIGQTGSEALANAYNIGDAAGTYAGALTATAGTLANPLGYLYAFNAGTLTVTAAPASSGGVNIQSAADLPTTVAQATQVPILTIGDDGQPESPNNTTAYSDEEGSEVFMPHEQRTTLNKILHGLIEIHPNLEPLFNLKNEEQD